MSSAFTYDNRTGRPPGRVVRAMGAVLPGVSRVWDQVDPYARAWRADNLEAIAGTGRRWVVLGDSLSQGIGASTHRDGWVGQLSRRLAADGHVLRVVNLSATGACVSDVVEQQLAALAQLGSRDDDVVTVMVGSNDLFGGAVRRQGIGTAFAGLVEAVPCGSLVTTLPQPTRAAGRANVPVEAAAAAGRIVMVDLRVTGPSSWRGRLAGDFFHPNDAGYAGIADGVEPAVRAALDHDTTPREP